MLVTHHTFMLCLDLMPSHCPTSAHLPLVPVFLTLSSQLTSHHLSLITLSHPTAHTLSILAHPFSQLAHLSCPPTHTQFYLISPHCLVPACFSSQLPTVSSQLTHLSCPPTHTQSWPVIQSCSSLLSCPSSPSCLC